MTLQALILFGHGSRDARWVEPLLQFQSILQGMLKEHWQIELAFLEFMTPNLEQCLNHFLEKTVIRKISILPMFIGMGQHLRHDLPLLLEKLSQQYPQLELQLLTSFGENTSLLQAAACALSSQLHSSQ